MRFTHLFFLLSIFIYFSCKEQKLQLYKIEGSQIEITDSLSADAEIDAFIKPYRIHVKKNLDSILAYSLETYDKTNGHLNTAIGNFMADAIYNRSYPIFKTRTGKDIDMVLLNHGSIRSIISKGDITISTAYELMPFENSVVIVTLKGSQLFKMLDYLTLSKEAHPISQLKIVVDANMNVLEAKIKNKTIDSTKTYYVATNDYLFNGGDGMNFFKPTDSLYILNYKIRSALIDTFKKIDTIKPTIDGRFIQLQ